MIEKVKACCKAHVPKIPEEILSHQVFQEELLEMANNATILKHLKQQASLIGHLEQQHLLGPKTTFLEFGAGRGKLSHWLQLAVGNNATDVNYLLIDRANIRYKVSEYQFFICGNYLEGYSITIIFYHFCLYNPSTKSMLAVVICCYTILTKQQK